MGFIDYTVKIRQTTESLHTLQIEVPDIIKDDPSLIDKVMHNRAKQGLIDIDDLPSATVVESDRTEVITVYREDRRVYPRQRAKKAVTDES